MMDHGMGVSVTTKLMDHDAWTTEDVPAVVGGFDLLRNRHVDSEIGALDGRVAAYCEMGKTIYFITTNARYVPLVPRIDPRQLVVCRDMRYGHDDPVLWPRMVSTTYPHLAAIPKAPTTVRGREQHGVMWWNPTQDDFVCPASGMTITRGLGRLRPERLLPLEKPCKDLLGECTAYNSTTPTPLLAQVMQTLRLSIERLKMPTTFTRMCIGVTTVQREYLELTGLLRYITRYQPRMQGTSTDAKRRLAFPDDCIGAFTEDPRVAQLFSLACLPFWLIRPLSAFADEKILRVVKPFEASSFLEMEPALDFPPVSATGNLDDRSRCRRRHYHPCTCTARESCCGSWRR
ncbi:hypothetical protein B0H14DRAFT_2503927 [Mycena olivaceomarginata]|nr:hypothetical protein B0H14DRAFT_2503927 [Mycena olivaceomarginata]